MRFKVKIGWMRVVAIAAAEVSCMNGFLVFYDKKGYVIESFRPDQWVSFRSV